MSGKALAAGIAANRGDQEPVATTIPLTCFSNDAKLSPSPPWRSPNSEVCSRGLNHCPAMSRNSAGQTGRRSSPRWRSYFSRSAERRRGARGSESRLRVGRRRFAKQLLDPDGFQVHGIHRLQSQVEIAFGAAARQIAESEVCLGEQFLFLDPFQVRLSIAERRLQFPRQYFVAVGPSAGKSWPRPMRRPVATASGWRSRSSVPATAGFRLHQRLKRVVGGDTAGAGLARRPGPAASRRPIPAQVDGEGSASRSIAL